VTSAVRWVLWSGTIGFNTSQRDRAAAAKAAGFERFSLSPVDVHEAEAAGWSAADIGRWAADEGLGLIMDPVVNWHPYDSAWPFRYAKFSLDEMLRMYRDLDCTSMTAVAMTDCPYPPTELAAPFGQLCRRAAQDGIDVHLEFIPMTVVPDLNIAWDIVRDAGESNGGLLFDTWHFFRGTPDFDLLASIPGERIFAVQINDAADEVQGSLWDDTRHRKLPGDGDFDLARVVQTLAAIDGLRWVGPEIFSAELAAMPAVDAARLAGGLVRSLVQSALDSS
jgi:sugar phosphate isomerase/epimerase